MKLRNSDSPMTDSVTFITGIFAVILLIALINVGISACDKPLDNCYDCRILTVFHICDTVIVCDTVEVWCDIDPEFFETFNTYYAEYPDQGFTVNQVVNCK